ncbi:Uncharacterised protein [Klebsiella oxytoca]|nr:Uncharacterised protein [Klebsiella oxytoca]
MGQEQHVHPLQTRRPTGLFCRMADHEWRHAKPAAYFLNAEGAAFKQLRGFRVHGDILVCQLIFQNHQFSGVFRTNKRLKVFTQSFSLFLIKRRF